MASDGLLKQGVWHINLIVAQRIAKCSGELVCKPIYFAKLDKLNFVWPTKIKSSHIVMYVNIYIYICIYIYINISIITVCDYARSSISLTRCEIRRSEIRACISNYRKISNISKISNIRRTKSPNLDVFRLVVQLSSPNPNEARC